MGAVIQCLQHLKSMGIVYVARYLLAPLVPVPDEDDGGHLPVPVGLLSVCQGTEEGTPAHWLTSAAESAVWERKEEGGGEEGKRGGKEGREGGGGMEGGREGGREEEGGGGEEVRERGREGEREEERGRKREGGMRGGEGVSMRKEIQEGRRG